MKIEAKLEKLLDRYGLKEEFIMEVEKYDEKTGLKTDEVDDITSAFCWEGSERKGYFWGEIERILLGKGNANVEQLTNLRNYHIDQAQAYSDILKLIK